MWPLLQPNKTQQKGMHVLSDIMYTLKWKAIQRQAII